MLLEQRQQLLVDVADHVGEDVDARAQERLRVVDARGVHGDAHAVLVRLVQDRAIQVGRQRLDGPASRVDPHLDQRDAALRQFLHVGACPLHRRHDIRGVAHVVRADLLERRQAAPRRQESRGVRILPGAQFFPELKGQLSEIASHRLAGRDAEVGEAVHVVEDVLARVVLRPAGQVLHVADVRMRIDQRRDDRLARQVHARSASRRLQLPLAADSREPAVLDQERRALDGGAAVAGDETGTLVEHRPRRLRGNVHRCRQEKSNQQS